MNFQRLLLILKARFGLILFTFLATVTITAVISFLLPPTYTATTNLVVDFKTNEALGGSSIPHQLLPNYIATQLDIIASHKVARKVVEDLKLDTIPAAREEFNKATDGQGSIRDWLARALIEVLSVKPALDSNMITIEYSSTDPRFAAAIANAFAESYIETNLELTVEPARQAAVWFKDQVRLLRGNLEQGQGRLSAYQQEKGIVAIDERLDVENASLNQISEELVNVQAENFDTQSRLAQMNEFKSKGSSAESLAAVISSPLVIDLKQGLATKESALNQMSGQLGKNHPQYQRALAEVAATRAKLAEEINVATAGIANSANITQKREDELRKALVEQKTKVLELKSQRDQMEVLAQDSDSAQKSYDEALQKFNQVSLESQLDQTNVAVLNRAIEPLKPSKPKIFLNIALAIFLGGILGIGLALLLETTKRYIRSEDDLSEGLGLPVLGMIIR